MDSLKKTSINLIILQSFQKLKLSFIVDQIKLINFFTSTPLSADLLYRPSLYKLLLDFMIDFMFLMIDQLVIFSLYIQLNRFRKNLLMSLLIVAIGVFWLQYSIFLLTLIVKLRKQQGKQDLLLFYPYIFSFGINVPENLISK